MGCKKIGKQSILFKEAPVVTGWGSLVGKKESEGPLGNCFDVTASDDDYYGGDNWEEAESRMQHRTVMVALERSGLKKEQIDYIVAGDLLGQLIATSFGIKDFEIPVFGIYGACSMMGEAITLASVIVEGSYADNVIALTSSHYATAEKQFRFPLAYGNQRPLCATTTVTGCGALIISSGKERKNRQIYVKSATVGLINDYGITDANNMGAAMAPAAYSTIKAHFTDNNTDVSGYDKIVTGDLGNVGSKILSDMLMNDGIDISKKHLDCGNMIYGKKQDAHSGGSGCGCFATTLCGFFLPRMMNGEFNKILCVPTGALLSPVSTHEGRTIPSIAHAIVFEAE